MTGHAYIKKIVGNGTWAYVIINSNHNSCHLSNTVYIINILKSELSSEYQLVILLPIYRYNENTQWNISLAGGYIAMSIKSNMILSSVGLDRRGCWPILQVTSQSLNCLLSTCFLY